MQISLSGLEKTLTGLARALMAIAVPVAFRIHVWVVDQIFLASLKSKVLRPTFLGRVMRLMKYALKRLRVLWRSEFTEYAVSQYSVRNRLHYGPGGRGYAGYQELTKQEQRDIFNSFEGRLGMVICRNPQLLGYKDGQSFLELGCGMGQNIAVIARMFPNSVFVGVDLDSRSLAVAAAGTETSKNVSLSQGDLADLGYLSGFEDESSDNVFLCHVFSTLLSISVNDTRAMRQSIVDQLVRIAKETVLIIDQQTCSDDFGLNIEQETRAAPTENLLRYFNSHGGIGEACILQSKGETAVLFRKLPRPANRPVLSDTPC